MPQTTSARKRAHQNLKRRSISLWRKRRIKAQVKSFLKAVQDQDVKTAEAEYRKTCGILDKVACTSSIHRNTAARRKSRLAKRLNALKAATA